MDNYYIFEDIESGFKYVIIAKSMEEANLTLASMVEPSVFNNLSFEDSFLADDIGDDTIDAMGLDVF